MNHAKARQILGVGPDATEDDIKKAYKKLAMKVHPDRPDGDAEQFKQLAEAYEQLLKPEAKSHFKNGDWFGSVDFGDVMSKFRFNADRFTGSNYDGFDKVARELYFTITPQEAFDGCTKLVRMANGADSLEERFEVSAGIEDDTLITVIEKGNTLFRIFVKIQPRNDNDFSIDWGKLEPRKRGDVVKKVSVSPFLMMTGGWHREKMIDGSEIKVHIPAGMQPNARLKVKEKGYWRDEKLVYRGDCYLVVIPRMQKLTDIPKDELKSFTDIVLNMLNESN